MSQISKASSGNENAITSVNQQVFTSSGTYTPTVGMKYCIIEAVGGGGGGGGSANGGAYSVSGGGGGGGGYSRTVATAAAIGASQVVTIGAGGTGAPIGNNPGTNGGDTSLGVICIAKGGSGGFGNNGNQGVFGGAGGIPGTGDFTFAGSEGMSSATCIATTIGAGGSSYFGGMVYTDPATPPKNGATGLSYGGGGSAGITYGGGGEVSGGDGADGVIIITEYI